MKCNKSYIFTGIKKTCTGCGACTKVCKHYALVMQTDEEGFIYPKLDEKVCIECGLCDMICPSVNNDYSNKNTEQHCYLATTSDKSYYEQSASIGLCTMISEMIIEKGGVVFGCFLDEENWHAYHIDVYTKGELENIRNSKYLQSDTKDTFCKAKDKLIQGIPVLYIGTPCEIAGLKAFLRKEYENLFTIDIICHGTFSPVLLPIEIDYWERLFHGKVRNFHFRSKRVYKY